MTNPQIPNAQDIAKKYRKDRSSRKWFQKKRFIIPIALLTVSGISGVVNGKSSDNQNKAAMLKMPALATLNASDASAKLENLGFNNVNVQDASSEERTVIVQSNWQVCSTKPAVGTSVDPDSTVVLLAVKNSEDCSTLSKSVSAQQTTKSDQKATNVTVATPKPSTSKRETSEAASRFGVQTESELAAIATIEKFQSKYEKASNDLQRADVRLKRDDAICKANGGSSVKNWTGVVKTIGGTSEGQGYLTVQVAEGVTLETWNNTLSDIDDNTLIPRKSPLYKTVLSLKEGQLVTFSGSFVPADGSCLNTMNFTEVFAMYTPEFVFRFSQIKF